LFIMIWFMWYRTNEQNWITLTLFFLWEMHYFLRCLIFPMLIPSNQVMYWLTFVTSIFFTWFNTTVNAEYLFWICSPPVDYPVDTYWLKPNFFVGIFFFFLGLVINWKSDIALLQLRQSRKKDESRYKLPYGGLFEYISCPNYFGEIMEWGGYALASWNIASFSFFLWTCANLIPRGHQHHQDYKAWFKNYPKNRKAIIPYLF